MVGHGNLSYTVVCEERVTRISVAVEYCKIGHAAEQMV